MGDYKYIHTKHIDAIASGDTEFLIELVDIFLAQIPAFTANMKNSFENKDWKVLAREAHTAKSSVLTFGMEKTGTLLKDIQVKVEANELQTVSEMIDQAINEMEAAVPELLELKDSLI